MRSLTSVFVCVAISACAGRRIRHVTEPSVSAEMMDINGHTMQPPITNDANNGQAPVYYKANQGQSEMMDFSGHTMQPPIINDANNGQAPVYFKANQGQSEMMIIEDHEHASMQPPPPFNNGGAPVYYKLSAAQADMMVVEDGGRFQPPEFGEVQPPIYYSVKDGQGMLLESFAPRAKRTHQTQANLLKGLLAATTSSAQNFTIDPSWPAPVLNASVIDAIEDNFGCASISELEWQELSELNRYRHENYSLGCLKMQKSALASAKLHGDNFAMAPATTSVCCLHSWLAQASIASIPGVNYANGCFDCSGKYWTDPIMWYKTQEIFNNTNFGWVFECGINGGIGQLTALQLITAYANSPAHNDVIANQGIWSGYVWTGVGISADDKLNLLAFVNGPDSLGWCEPPSYVYTC